MWRAPRLPTELVPSPPISRVYERAGPARQTRFRAAAIATAAFIGDTGASGTLSDDPLSASWKRLLPGAHIICAAIATNDGWPSRWTLGKPWPAATGQTVMAANLVGVMTVRLSRWVTSLTAPLSVSTSTPSSIPDNVELCKHRLRKATTVTPGRRRRSGGSTVRHAVSNVYLDATYLHVRNAASQVTLMAVVIATGITATGEREVLGVDVIEHTWRRQAPGTSIAESMRGRDRAIGAFPTNDSAARVRGRLVITKVPVQYAGPPTKPSE
jgi:hypothetical protein